MTQSVMVEAVPAAVRVVGYGPDPGSAQQPAENDSSGRNSWWYVWTWLVTPHIEFGAVYVGMIVVLFLDMSLGQALLGIFLGTAFGALSHGILTARGVRLRVPQIVLGRLAFGGRGNLFVTTIMAIISSFGWFVVNSVVAALAINSLFGFPTIAALAVVVLVQLVVSQLGISFKTLQRYLFPVVTVILVIAGIFAFAKVDPSADPGVAWNLNGIIAIVVVACIAWAYTIGWNPYATDYSTVVPTGASPKTAGICSAVGLFCATMFLMSVGAVAGVIVTQTGETAEPNPTTQFVSFLPQWLGVLVLLGLIAGTWTNNAITLKSARNVFSVDRLGLSPEVGRILGPVVMTVAAFFLGWAATLNLASNFEGYVMVLGVWIGPWLNIALVDYLVRRKDDPTSLLYSTTASNKWGIFALVFGIAGSVLIYALQVFDGGRLPHGGVSYAALGMLAGFYLSAVVYSFGLKRLLKEKAAESNPA